MGTEKRDRQKEGRRQRIEAEVRAWKRRRRNRTIMWTAIAVFAVATAAVAVNALGSEEEQASPTTTLFDPPTTTQPASTLPPEPYGSGECPPAEGVEAPVLTFVDRPQQCIDPAKTYTAVFDTTEGTIRVELDTETTPATTNNFVVLARYGYYDDTKIHRTDPTIGIIQGGSPHTGDASDPGPGYTIVDEGGPFTYEPGQLVMARSSGPNSAGAQFFFVVTEEASLLDDQGTYVVFGRVTEGMEVLEAILALHEEDPSSTLGGAPSRDVVIRSVTIEEG